MEEHPLANRSDKRGSRTRLTVVLGDSLGPAGSTGLDLTGPQSNGQVGNVGGLGLTGPVGCWRAEHVSLCVVDQDDKSTLKHTGHDSPSCTLRELNAVRQYRHERQQKSEI